MPRLIFVTWILVILTWRLGVLCGPAQFGQIFDRVWEKYLFMGYRLFRKQQPLAGPDRERDEDSGDAARRRRQRPRGKTVKWQRVVNVS